VGIGQNIEANAQVFEANTQVLTRKQKRRGLDSESKSRVVRSKYASACCENRYNVGTFQGAIADSEPKMGVVVKNKSTEFRITCASRAKKGVKN